jgi:peptidyl-prolyl cis-trans isomerase B (cyclophilin B)
VPTNKQRREAARRHLERQLQRRDQDAARRRQRNLLVTVIGTVVVLAVIVVVVVMTTSDNKKGKPTAASTTTTTSTPTPTTSPTEAATGRKTAGHCGYASGGPVAKDVGVPPDPAKPDATDRTLAVKTTQGDVTIALDNAAAPCNAGSIAYLASKGYYDNAPCHRLVTSGIYVLQCGDPSGTGSGGPGYTSKDENLAAADYSAVGTVAMANGGPNTNGSQFFVIYKDSSTLPKSYTVIGHVTAGMDVVQKVAAAGETDANPSSPGDGAPKLAIKITSVTVTPSVTGSGTFVQAAPATTSPAASAP